MREDGVFRISTQFQTTRNAHKALDIHIGSKWITARHDHITFHINAGWIDLGEVAMDDDSIVRLKENVRGNTAGECLCKIYTQDGLCAVFTGPKHLSGVHGRAGQDTA